MKSCNGCVPPKRHEKCHDHCPDYNTEKIMDIVTKAPAEKERQAAHSIVAQKAEGVDRAYKHRRKYKMRVGRR